MEELESVLENSSNGTVVTGAISFPGGRAGQETQRSRIAVDLNDFRQDSHARSCGGGCVGLVSISPGI